MFDIGFSEVLLIFVIALVVLGPEKLPRAASQVGRWVGRARAMARQFKEQLEEEVNLENVRKAHKEAAAKEEAASKDAASGGGAAGTSAAGGDTGAQSNAASSAAGTGANYSGPDPTEFRADTFSHAHPTNEFGANPLTENGAPPEEPKPPAADASSPSAPLTAEAGVSPDNTHRTDSTEAYAPATTLTPTLPASEPLREPVPATTTQSDNHGHS
jgi:sec-independent protein translocase protein TatB